MPNALSGRRLTENEAIFKRLNQTGHHVANHLTKDISSYFYCECASKKCTDRLIINACDYGEIHQVNNTFTILPGHAVLLGEEVILEQPDYSVVQELTQLAA